MSSILQSNSTNQLQLQVEPTEALKAVQIDLDDISVDEVMVEDQVAQRKKEVERAAYDQLFTTNNEPQDNQIGLNKKVLFGKPIEKSKTKFDFNADFVSMAPEKRQWSNEESKANSSLNVLFREEPAIAFEQLAGL